VGNLVDVNTEPLATVTSLDPVHVTIAVSVTTAYPGANAEVVEQSVAAPIEAQVNGVDDMLYMSSTSTNDGGYALMVTFEVGADPDITAVNVQNRVAVATGQLPQEVTRQGVVTQKQSTNTRVALRTHGCAQGGCGQENPTQVLDSVHVGVTLKWAAAV